MRKLAIFSCAFTAAAAAYVWLLTPMMALVCAVFTAIIALFFTKGDMAIRLRIVSVAMAIGFLWCWGYERLQIAPLCELCGEDVLVSATVSGYPEKTTYGCRVQTSVKNGTMLLYLNDEHENLKPGDQITLRAEVADVSRGSGGDENLYFQAKGISLLAFENETPTVTPADSVALRYLPAHWAKVITQRITKLFPQDTEGFMRALMMGEGDGIDYTLRNQMTIAGIVHIFSVSGMHVSLLVGFFMVLLRNKRVAAICAIAAMLVFAAMLGFSPSVTRAFLMNTVQLLAPILGRDDDPPTSLSFALLVILFANPWAIASLSLQLSFLSMCGIILFAQRIHDRICNRFPVQGKSRRIFKMASANVAMSLSATVLTLPLIAVSFGTVSLVAPLSNVLLMSLVSFIFTSGFVILLVGLIAPLGILLAWGLSWLIRLLLIVLKYLCEIPFAAVYTDSEYVVVWLLAAYAMIAVFLLLRKERRLPYLIGSLAATLFCAIGFCMMDVPKSSVVMLDVGQGQSILVQSAAFHAVIDCGGDSGAKDGEKLARKILMTGNRRLDAVVLTHYDEDHTCGLEQLAQRVQIRCLYLPDISDDSGGHKKVLALAKKSKIEICYVRQDISIEAEGIVLRIIRPLQKSSDNDGLGALMSMGECDILVTGDMSMDAELALLRHVDIPKLEVLVAGHHGSKYATSMRLLEETQPEVVLISVGKNGYGHPSQEVLQRIESVGAMVYRTDWNGDITITR